SGWTALGSAALGGVVSGFFGSIFGASLVLGASFLRASAALCSSTSLRTSSLCSLSVFAGSSLENRFLMYEQAPLMQSNTLFSSASFGGGPLTKPVTTLVLEVPVFGSDLAFALARFSWTCCWSLLSFSSPASRLSILSFICCTAAAAPASCAK